MGLQSINGLDSEQVEALEYLLRSGGLDELKASLGDFESLQAGEIGNSGSPVDVVDPLQIPLETPQDVSGSRSLNTWYQNTTGHPLKVTVISGAGSGSVNLIMHNNDSQTENNQVKDTLNTGTNSVEEVTNSVTVAPNDYYQVDISTGSVAGWTEQRVGVSA